MFTIHTNNAIREGMRKYKQVFGRENLSAILLDAGKYAGVIAEGIVEEYPRATGKPLVKHYRRTRKDGTSYMSKFKSARQQGYVFALAAKGKIPYRRTGQLGRSITSSADLSGNAVITRVGTNNRAAPYVIGNSPRPQSAYHRGNWTPLTSSIRTGLPRINRAFEERMQKNIREGLRR